MGASGDSRASGTPAVFPQLDGLRAIAVLAVAWSHWERPYQFGIPFGAGVHLFYVLSGFLITGILLRLGDESRRMASIRAFYARRALRIMPAFYVTLALAWWAGVPPLRETLAWHATYLTNVHIVATETWPGAISHFWSLAVEEQFYLIWPWLIVFVPRRWLGPAIWAAVLTAPAFRWWLASEGYRENLLGVLTPGSLDSLGVGALIALAGGSRHAAGSWQALLTSRGTAGTVALLTFSALAAILTAQGAGLPVPMALVAVKQTLQALVFGWIVLRAAEGFGGVAGRVLSAGPVIYIGRISYGLYLAHGFAGALLAGAGVNSRELPEPWRLLALAGVTFAVAAASWHLLESPLNSLKRYVPYSRAPRAPDARGPVPQVTIAGALPR